MGELIWCGDWPSEAASAEEAGDGVEGAEGDLRDVKGNVKGDVKGNAKDGPRGTRVEFQTRADDQGFDARVTPTAADLVGPDRKVLD